MLQYNRLGFNILAMHDIAQFPVPLAYGSTTTCLSLFCCLIQLSDPSACGNLLLSVYK